MSRFFKCSVPDLCILFTFSYVSITLGEPVNRNESLSLLVSDQVRHKPDFTATEDG